MEIVSQIINIKNNGKPDTKYIEQELKKKWYYSFALGNCKD